MSILICENLPFTGLINARNLVRNSVLDTVKKVGIREYGVYNSELVADKWNLDGVEGIKPEKIIGALNNNDTDHMLLSVLRENTEGVLEGLAIAAYAVDTKLIELVLPESNAELEKQIHSIAKEQGLDVKISIGMVDVYSARKSIIHHFETAASIAALFQKQENFIKKTVVTVKKHGSTTDSPVEIEFGRSIGDLVDEIDRKELKAIAIGTRVYDSSALDLVLEEDFPLGNGVITLFNSKCCMADESEKFILKVRREGCGKCNFCREGAIQIHTMLKDITQGKGKVSDFSMIKEIGDAMKFSCLCSMGQTGADFVLDSLKHFEEEVEAHVRKKRCPSEMCSAFMNIYIDPTSCVGCEECIDVCKANCIEGKRGYIHMIDEFDCTKCGKCIEACTEGAVIRTTGRVPKLPERLVKVGRFNKR